MLKVISVTPQDNGMLLLTFENKLNKVLDMKKYLSENIQDLKKVKLLNGKVILHNGVEIDENVLWNDSVLYMPPKILKADINDGYKVDIYYENGELRQFDFAPLLNEKFYSRLNDYEVFKKFYISVDTLVWDKDLDIAPEYLYEESILMKK